MVAKWFVRQTMNTPGMEQGGKLGAASKDTVVLTLKCLPYLLPHTAQSSIFFEADETICWCSFSRANTSITPCQSQEQRDLRPRRRGKLTLQSRKTRTTRTTTQRKPRSQIGEDMAFLASSLRWWKTQKVKDAIMLHPGISMIKANMDLLFTTLTFYVSKFSASALIHQTFEASSASCRVGRSSDWRVVAARITKR
jgi:hypothetical protein